MERTLERARILNAEDVITSDTYVMEEGPDRKGNFVFRNEKTNKCVRAHPSRILPCVEGGAPVYRENDTVVVKCGECQIGNPDSPVISVEISQEMARCSLHGQFVLDWSKIDSGVRPAAPEAEKRPVVIKTTKKSRPAGEKAMSSTKAPALIDFENIKSVGELWTKAGIVFDYPGYDVKAHVLIIVDAKHSRKFCFNSFNGTWGKKSKDDILKAFIANSKGADGKDIGYPIKGEIEAQRRRLEKEGYAREV